MAKKRPDQNVLCTWYSALNAAHFLTLDHEYTPFYCNSPLLSPQLLFTKPMSNNSHGTPPISPPPSWAARPLIPKKGFAWDDWALPKWVYPTVECRGELLRRTKEWLAKKHWGTILIYFPPNTQIYNMSQPPASIGGLCKFGQYVTR